MNATLHVYCFFPVPGSYTIACFVSDALTFSIFDHDAFVRCVQGIGLDIAFTSAYKKKKAFLLKTAIVISEIVKQITVIAVLST